MKTLDWFVMFGWLVALVSYGLWRGRKSGSVDQFLLAGKSMPWYAMGLSIMATQASAITFISTTAQAYIDGMRFVQFYFGLPLAMILISAVAVPIFHNSGVYTAYEYLEKRFDVKTRLLVTIIFLVSRGLAAGISLYAPSVVLSVILGWPERLTVLLMGSLVVLYTTMGGIKAVTWADVQQMAVIMMALVFSLFMAISMMPADITFSKALDIAGMAGRLNPVTTNFDPNDRYNIWSGLIGGMFLALAYFGTDQSQVQRYLTGKSITESRISLLFNAVAKIPMQFLILFIGAMVYVFFVFEKPPMIFHPVEKASIEQAKYDRAHEARAAAARAGGAEGIRHGPQRCAGVGPEGLQRHQLHLPGIRHQVSAGRLRGPDHRRDLLGSDVRDLGRDQLAGDRDRDRRLQAVHDRRRNHRHSAAAGLADRDRVLGSLGHRLRQLRRQLRCADRSCQHDRLALLRRNARRVCTRVLFQELHRHRSVLWRAGWRSRDLLLQVLHRHRVPLVQRHRMLGGDPGGDVYFVDAADNFQVGLM
jgi:SSS family transporter